LREPAHSLSRSGHCVRNGSGRILCLSAERLNEKATSRARRASRGKVGGYRRGDPVAHDGDDAAVDALEVKRVVVTPMDETLVADGCRTPEVQLGASALRRLAHAADGAVFVRGVRGHGCTASRAGPRTDSSAALLAEGRLREQGRAARLAVKGDAT